MRTVRGIVRIAPFRIAKSLVSGPPLPRELAPAKENSETPSPNQETLLHIPTCDSLEPCGTKVPLAIAAPLLLSPKVSSLTIAFSSNTFPHVAQIVSPPALLKTVSVP